MHVYEFNIEITEVIVYYLIYKYSKFIEFNF